MTDFEMWVQDGNEMGWEMPSAPWWKRLPVIRHIRAIYGLIKLEQHNRFWLRAGLIPTGYDEWVVYGIARGMEKPHD